VNVVIVGPFWFPRGSAASARARNLAFGLRDCGARVHVVSMAPRAVVPGATPAPGIGEHEGITYECVAPFFVAARGWRDRDQSVPLLRGGWLDKLVWFGGVYAATPTAVLCLRQLIDRGICDLVLVYDRSALRMTPLVRLCRARRVPTVLDVTEVSEHLRSRLNAIYWDFAVGTRATPRLFDGLTVITSGLESFYHSRGCARTLVLPAIEGWPEPSPWAPTGNPEFRLAYVGSLQPRDAPEVLLEAMRRLAVEPTRVTLDVVGHYEGTERGRQFARRCASDPTLTRRVRFLGSLSDAALAAHLASADGLLLTRRDARTEEMSFPTRLVEYLRTGRPVFVSNVGDISRYLSHGTEAVLLDPGDARKVAAAIAKVALRPDRGAEIGRRGREAGARHFDRRRHAARLLEFAAGLREVLAA